MRPHRFITVALGLLAASCLLAGAADWSFDPVLTLYVERNTNPRMFGTDSNADTVLAGNLDLAWGAATPRSRTGFRFSPRYERYQDHDQLNNTLWHAGIEWTFNSSRSSNWTGNLNWSRSERLQVSFEHPEENQVALPRIETTTLSGNLSNSTAVSARSRLVWGITARRTSYGNEADSDLAALRQDRALEFTVNGGWERALSRMATGRVEYRGSRIDEGDYLGSRNVHRLVGVYTYGSVERLQYEITVGGATSRVSDRGQLAEEAGMPEGSSSGVVGGVGVSGTVGRRTRLSGGYTRDFTGSGGTVGVSKTDSVSFSINHPVGRNSALSLAGRASRLSPEYQGEGSTGRVTTKGIRGEYAAFLGQHWALVFAGERISQSADQAETLELNYTTWSFGLRWAPTARRR